MFLVFSNHFDMLMSKIIFKKSKNIIDMHFDTKNYLKSNHNHTVKQATRLNVELSRLGRSTSIGFILRTGLDRVRAGHQEPAIWM